jgi:hypothetical protein
MIIAILIALYLTVIVWFIRNMGGIPSNMQGVDRVLWFIGYSVYALLWPITVPMVIKNEMKGRKSEDK